MIKLEIPFKIESQNKFSNRRGFGAQFAYKNYRDEWMQHIMCALKMREDMCDGRRANVFIESRRTRLLDKGNLYGGAKPVLDSLKHFGLIVDDSPKWIEEEVFQTQVKAGEECTIITIEYLDACNAAKTPLK